MDLQDKFIRDFSGRFDVPQSIYEKVGMVLHYGLDACLISEKIRSNVKIRDPTYDIACSKDYYMEYLDIQSSDMFIIYDVRNHRIQNSLNNSTMRQMSIPPINQNKLDKIVVKKLIPEGTFDNAKCLLCQVLIPFRECLVLDCGDKAAKWILKYFKNTNFRLGYFIRYVQQEEKFWKNFDLIYRVYNVQKNSVKSNYINIMSLATAKHLYQDMYKYIIENCLDNLIIIDVNIEPFQEHRWNWIKIDDAIFKKRSLIPNSIDSYNSVDELKDMLWKWQYNNLMTEWEMCSAGCINIGQEVQVHLSTVDNNIPILENIKRYCLAHQSQGN
ncbi:uncharacterized protein LOC116852740 [Odontomachus brunneus]|uniref:uncharacterized protein LOC116852740 n=1 Tax=Odontomachus brunneus TaxID=486640 RepID=UPI0013F19EA0|nr:uncharacterized protein LOC116852740 [Odontomachus brunneus]